MAGASGNDLDIAKMVKVFGPVSRIVRNYVAVAQTDFVNLHTRKRSDLL